MDTGSVAPARLEPATSRPTTVPRRVMNQFDSSTTFGIRPAKHQADGDGRMQHIELLQALRKGIGT